MERRIECPQCRNELTVIGYHTGYQAYVANCPLCRYLVLAVPDVMGVLRTTRCEPTGEPKPETWRDRAIRDPMF